VNARAFHRPYLGAFTAAASRVLRKRGELGVRLLFYGVLLVVFAALWKAATAAAGGAIAGYDYRALLWYVATAEGAVIATKPRMIEDIGTDIGSGAVATEMLRPVSVMGFRLAAELGEALVRLAMAMAIGWTFVWLVVGGPPGGLIPLALATPIAAVAVACNLAAQHAFAGAAFWLHDAKAAWFLYQKFVFLLGGMLLPLEVFPPWLERLAWALPFWTMSYAPARVLTGHVEPWLLAAQAAWLVLLVSFAAAVFRAGERRLEVAGG
jgi:viologen exporter family transport system permease protein